MKRIFIIIILITNIFSQNFSSYKFKTKKINFSQVSNLIYKSKKKFGIVIGGDYYKCVTYKDHNYCINKNKKLLRIESKYRNSQGYFLINIYNNGGYLIEKGYEGDINNNRQPVGLWEIYDYKNKQIKIINFNNKPKIRNINIKKWAILNDPNGFIDIRNAIFLNKRAWQVEFDSIIVYIDSENGKILGFNLYVNNRRKYKCVKSNLKRKRKIFEVKKICNLHSIAIAE